MISDQRTIKQLRKESFSGRATKEVANYMLNNHEFQTGLRQKVFQSAANLVDANGRSKVEWPDMAMSIRLYKNEGKFYMKKEPKESPEERRKEDILKEIENYGY